MSDVATAAAEEEAKRFREASDKIRERSDAAAKGLAALGTAGLTAVGIAKFSDIFPFPPDEGGWVFAVTIGFLAMTFVLAAFTFRLWNANRPLVTSVNEQDMVDLDGPEKAEVKKIYDVAATRNGVDRLDAYEARGQRFERIADRTQDAATATAIRTKAERVRADIDVARARGQLVVIRRRMNRALTGYWAIAYAIIFVGGLFAFGIGVDRLDSERSARVAAYKACADAVAVDVREDKLPKICSDLTKPDPAKTPTADQASSRRVEALGAQYRSCVDTAVEAEQNANMCDDIKAKLVAAAS